MTEPLGVTPDGLRATAGDLADVSSRMAAVLSSLQGKLAGEGPAWGDDSTGHQFANGASGYLAQVDWVNSSINAKADLLNQYSQGLKTAADTLEQQDQG
jgi:uncharacterized protein YukE